MKVLGIDIIHIEGKKPSNRQTLTQPLIVAATAMLWQSGFERFECSLRH